MKLIGSTLLTVISFFAVTGCSSLGIGKKDFSCPHPNGITCMSTRDVYEATNSGSNPNNSKSVSSNQESSNRDPKLKEKNQKDSTVTVRRVTDPVIDTFVTPRLPDRPVPVRTPAVVMRIKVYPYEDAKTGALHAPGFIFTEIEPRKWTIGKHEAATTQGGRLLKPLEADHSVVIDTKRKNSQ